MTLEEKIEYIKDNKKIAVLSLCSVLDKIYDIRDKFFENGQLKEGLKKDEKAEKELQKLFRDADKYEKVRTKILNDDFNLSLVEINYVALSYFYITCTWKNTIKRLEKSIAELEKAVEFLMDKKS